MRIRGQPPARPALARDAHGPGGPFQAAPPQRPSLHAGDRGLEADYLRYLAPEMTRLARTACWLALLLTAAFGLIDPWAIPSGVAQVWTIRAVLLMVTATTLALTYRPVFLARYEAIFGGAFLVLGLGVLAMIACSATGEAARAVYFVGALLVLMGMYALSFLRRRTSAGVSAVLLAGYLLESWALDDLRSAGPWPVVLANACFFVAVLTIGALSQRERDRYARQSFLRKRELEHELDVKEHARRLSEHLSNHDGLTGLPNRESFERDLGGLLARARAEGSVAAVLFLDLDGFKAVNDTFGHLAGDHVLRVIAQRIRACVSHADLAARLGGDEFVVALSLDPDVGQGAVELAQRIAARIESHVAEPIALDDTRVALGASTGIALFPADGESIGELIAAADSQMYAVKRVHKAARRREGEPPVIDGHDDAAHADA
jgi:diguanylate cyclase (GGDEF)-like protein